MTPEFDDGFDDFGPIEIAAEVPYQSKRRRMNEQNRSLETIAQHLKQSQSKKMELLEKMIGTPQEQSDLQLFFASICKTVEKFTALDQATIKMEVTKIVNEMEVMNLKAKHIVILDDNLVTLESINANVDH